jgi:hypothetical protein
MPAPIVRSNGVLAGQPLLSEFFIEIEFSGDPIQRQPTAESWFGWSSLETTKVCSFSKLDIAQDDRTFKQAVEKIDEAFENRILEQNGLVGCVVPTTFEIDSPPEVATFY